MNLPVATDKSAFISGLLIPIPIMSLDWLQSKNLVSSAFFTDSLLVLVVASLPITVILFVSGIPRYKTSKGEIKLSFFPIPFTKRYYRELYGTYRRFGICILGSILTMSILAISTASFGN